MSYAIMRCKKLSGMGSVAASLKHCYRERETLNADPSRTPQNEHKAARTTDEAMGKLRSLLPEKRRKDAVLAVEYVLTASPEWWGTATGEDQADFFRRSMRWVGDKYGEKNIIAATVHRDESSPHLSVFVVPRTLDGRLSAKSFIGNRDKMSADQTSFARCVVGLRLERGIKGSKAKHQRVNAFYAAIEKPEHKHGWISGKHGEPEVLEKRRLLPDIVETPVQVLERINKTIHKHYEPVIQEAATARLDRRRAKESHRVVESLQVELKQAKTTLDTKTAETKEKLERVEADRDYWKKKAQELGELHDLFTPVEVMALERRLAGYKADKAEQVRERVEEAEKQRRESEQNQAQEINPVRSYRPRM
jgi:hypothetical protein